jgi:hypothetical protein
MNDPMLAAAIENNASWCAAVCATHGVPTTTESGILVTHDRPPTYYPDAITLTREVTAEDVSALIGERAIASVKDSFATLDLAPLGFDLLFAASWITMEAPLVTDKPAWQPVSSAEGMHRWRAAHGDADSIRDELIDNPNVAIVMGDVGAGSLAGAIAFRSEHAVGISNMFVTDGNPVSAWQAVVANVTSIFPGLPIVGYEQGEDLTAAIAAGFTEIGPLRVWIRESPAPSDTV